MRAAIVVPTVRADCARAFIDAWQSQFSGHRLILVEDAQSKSDIGAAGIEHYCWADIDRDFGEDSWIIPRRTDCVRSYGIYLASREECDLIVSLDDDCFPLSPSFLEEHFRALNTPAEQEAWVSTGDGLWPRGIPYERLTRTRCCVLNHGLWTGIPDYDALTQLVGRRLQSSFQPKNQVVPTGSYFPMCGMNVAFRPELAAAMYFLLMGSSYPYDRFGDIWCGILVKRICDHLGWSVRSGGPSVKHARASNVWHNLKKEESGYQVNEVFWESVDSITLTGGSLVECYSEIASNLKLDGEYWDKLRTAMLLWSKRFWQGDVKSLYGPIRRRAKEASQTTSFADAASAD